MVMSPAIAWGPERLLGQGKTDAAEQQHGAAGHQSSRLCRQGSR
jgi:hypothetical protein